MFWAVLGYCLYVRLIEKGFYKEILVTYVLYTYLMVTNLILVIKFSNKPLSVVYHRVYGTTLCLSLEDGFSCVLFA